MKARRNISVGNETYRWTHAKLGAVIWNDQGKQFKATLNDLVAGQTIQAGPKGLEQIAITPAMIAKYIKEHPEMNA